jgi:antirestriction protein ArdC
LLREYTVFNVAQCESLPDSVKTGKPLRVRNPDTRDDLADEFLRSTGADIREGHRETYDAPSRDFISMPAFEAFKGADHFYSVAYHELVHWTAHGSRLDRDLKNRFGSRSYAGEELQNLAPRSFVRSSALMVISGTPGTSDTGLNC